MTIKDNYRLIGSEIPAIQSIQMKDILECLKIDFVCAIKMYLGFAHKNGHFYENLIIFLKKVARLEQSNCRK